MRHGATSQKCWQIASNREALDACGHLMPIGYNTRDFAICRYIGAVTGLLKLENAPPAPISHRV
jgi:hypothetical protein